LSYTPEAGDGGTGAAYAYRADGMRVRKVTGFTMHWIDPTAEAAGYYVDEVNYEAPTYRYFYDGQMMQEDDKTIPNLMGAPTISGNSYALGARGIDRIMPWTYASGTRTNGTASYPVYDGHGNMILTLAKNGTNFTHGNERSYDVWGTPSDNGDPAQRYCANLGHVTDDESGLIYMRARYYEPSTGRFLSEDPARDGANWYVYCWNEPVGRADYSGKSYDDVERLLKVIGAIGCWALAFTTGVFATMSFTPAEIAATTVLAANTITATLVFLTLGTTDLDTVSGRISASITLVSWAFVSKFLKPMLVPSAVAGKSSAGLVIAYAIAQALMIGAFLLYSADPFGEEQRSW